MSTEGSFFLRRHRLGEHLSRLLSLEQREKYRIEKPWPSPRAEDCYFYHTMTYPDGQTVVGTWTIPDFANYIGGYDLAGKTVLDVGTASGFLTFNAEKRGARVTAIDLPNMTEQRQVPFSAGEAYRNSDAWCETTERSMLMPMKNSWWYSWHRLGSKAEVSYRPMDTLPKWGRIFDVVVAGAIVEHIADPISAIGYWSKVAREAIIIAFTLVGETDELLMRPMTPWTDPGFAFAWWELSAGLYKRVFDNLGFDVEFATAHAQHNTPQGPVQGTRPTIIARRRLSV
jgi:2-polyprenyl-3-methyl-5-hydroxy-6-metoxy-1,4-benzoquinol methylase